MRPIGQDHVRAKRSHLGSNPSRDRECPEHIAERRRVQLDSARVLPLLLSQPSPPPLRCEDLRRLRVPVGVAWGARTRPYFGVVSRAAARCALGDKFEIDGATHMWPEERPVELVRLVERAIANGSCLGDEN